MTWSDFKKLVDDQLEGDDPEITYIDVDDFSCGAVNISNGPVGLIITENAPKPDRD